MHLQGLDIGPESLKNFQAELQDCKSVIWNGPMGVFEMEAFAKGTFGIAHTLAALSNKVSPDTSLQLRVLL
jgi:phosphoglycerate kinase